MTTRLRSEPAVLLIHGLGGTSYDLGALQKALHKAGAITHSITLPGHGTRPEDLTCTRAEAWLEALTAKYRELSAEHEVVHVAGMCMGALLALVLCQRLRHGIDRPDDRLALLAAPVYVDGWSTPWYRSLRHLVYRLPGVSGRMRVPEASRSASRISCCGASSRPSWRAAAAFIIPGSRLPAFANWIGCGVGLRKLPAAPSVRR